jgi:hypothetical protein
LAVLIRVLPILSIIILFCGSCKDEKHEVVDDRLSLWKKGDFYYMDEMFGKFEVERTDSFQVEKIISNGMEVVFEINWLNDSMYNLTYHGLNKNPHGISLPHDMDSLIKTCTITELTDTSYNEKATSNLNKSVNYTLMQLR